MRTVMAMVSLFLLVILLVETSQGIRFDVESSALLHKKIHKGSLKGGGDAVEVACKDGELCAGTTKKERFYYSEVQEVLHHKLPGFHEDYYGKERKLMTKPVAIPKTETSKEKDVGHKSMEQINRKKKPEDSVVEPPAAYPDLLDISGMDYSPAKRKSPIHN